MSLLFETKGLGIRLNGTEILRGLDLRFSRSEFVSLVGPNGAGKSTLLSILAGLRRNYTGSCLFKGMEVHRWPRRSLARKLAFVPQSVRIEFPFTVEQVVLMGRTPYCDGLFESPEDWQAVERAMQMADVIHLRQRDYRSLSGGEKQRVILASALAQAPEALILDEPATYLDISHQLGIYSLLQELARSGVLIVAATHDLNLASVFSDRVVVLHRGTIYCDAPPAQALQEEVLEKVFGVDAQLVLLNDRPWILYGGGQIG